MAFMAVLESDLRALSTEARRRHPAVKDAAEHAILKLRTLSSPSEISLNDDIVRIFLMACEVKTVKLSVIGLSCLQKLISHDAVAPSVLSEILPILKDHAEMSDENVQLKTLQTILIIFQSRLHPESEENMAQALGICLQLLENNRSSDSVRNTAAATFRQAVALVFEHVVLIESLPPEKFGSGSYMSRTSSVTNDVTRSMNNSELENNFDSRKSSLMRETTTTSGKLGLRLLEDLTALAAGGSACWLRVSSLQRTFALDILEFILSNYVIIFKILVPYEQVLRHQICSLLMTSLRTNYEVFLSMLIKLTFLDLPLWHRILVLEILRGFCVEAQTLRILFHNFDMHPKNTNVVEGMVKALARVVSSVQKARERVNVEFEGNTSLDRGRAESRGVPWVAFVDNLSKGVHRSSLWKRFSFHGKVIKVFIPFVNRRPNYKVSTFAFVHFASKKDLLKAVERMNNVVINGRRVMVSIAKYQRNSAARNLKRNIVVGSRDAGAEETKRKKPIPIVDDVGKKELLNKFHDGRTYKDTVLGRALRTEGFNVKVVRWKYAKNACLIVFHSVKEKKAAMEDKWEELSFWCSVKLLDGSILYKLGIEMGQASEDPGANNDMVEEDGTVDPWEENSSDWSQRDVQEGQEEQLGQQSLSDSQDRVEAWVRGAQQGDDTLIDGNLKGKVGPNKMLDVDFCSEETVVGGVPSQQGVSEDFNEGRENERSIGDIILGQDTVAQENGLSTSMDRSLTNGPVQENLRSNIVAINSVEVTNVEEVVLKLQNGSVSPVMRRHSGKCASRGWQRLWNVSKLLGVKIKGGEKAFMDKMVPMVNERNSEEGRGLGRRVKARAIRRFVDEKKPTIVFLQESKLEVVSHMLVRKMGKEFVVKDVVINSRFVVIKGTLEGVPGRGDFNAVLSQEEKERGAVNSVTMNMFRDFVSKANLFDLPLSGGRFTWCNNREAPTFERLDRFLVDQRLLACFPKISQSLQPRSVSDHNIILLENKECNWGQKPFRLFNYALEEDGFSEMMEKELVKLCKEEKGKPMSKVLKRVKGVVKKWSGRGYLELSGKIRLLEKRIQDLELEMQQGLPSVSMKSIIEAKKELWELQKKEESIWLQKSRLKWKMDGDKNTRFFHHSAAVRGRKNGIKSLKVGNEAVEDPTLIRASVVEFFNALEKPFSEEEVWEAIANSDSNKAPGSDGLNLGFFKKFWSSLKEDIMLFFKGFYVGKEWDMEVNHSFISLIPKKDNPEGMEDFRPISLVGGLLAIPLLFNLGGELRHLLLTKAVDMGLFLGFELGVQESSFKLSHLQFADDLIIFSKASIRDLKNIRRVLLIYELLVGLKINLVKSIIFGINVEEEVLAGWSNEIGCSVGNFPAEYLGLPLGSKRNSVAMWEPIVQRFHNKLSGWKKLNSIMAAFLWGGSIDRRNIHWVNWNLFASEKDSLWKRVACCVNNLDLNSKMLGNTSTARASWICRGVINNFFSSDEFGDCIRRNLRLKAGNDHSVEFWHDVWLGEVHLKDLFLHCMHFRIIKWIEQWLELISMLSNISLSLDEDDYWIWIQAKWDKHIWVGIAPPRVKTFIWQVAYQRVAVKEELLKRGVVGIEDSSCSLCGRNEVIFMKEKMDVVRMFFIARFRIVSWFAVSFDAVHIPLDSLVGDLTLADSVDRQKKGGSQPTCWVPPPDGFIKINVDWAMVNGWNKGGIGGLIRESRGVGLNKRIILESDSINALKWIKNPKLSSSIFLSLVKEIVSIIEGKDITLRQILRAANWEADRLAKDVLRFQQEEVFKSYVIRVKAFKFLETSEESLAAVAGMFSSKAKEHDLAKIRLHCTDPLTFSFDHPTDIHMLKGGNFMDQRTVIANVVSGFYGSFCLSGNGLLFLEMRFSSSATLLGIEWSLDNDASNNAVLVASEAHAISLAIEGLLGVVFTVASLTDEAVDVGELESPRSDYVPSAKSTGKTAVLCISMVDSLWLTILDALSLILARSQGEAIVLEILKGYQAFTQACGVLHAIEPLNSFLASLCKFTINFTNEVERKSVEVVVSKVIPCPLPPKSPFVGYS
ncbi:Cysteine synthase D1 isoform 1 [Hibiscus syriacus]|uniref:Cysteine synthase D1 isoform 1 n=1 Tax=Hibiscus syriacus TaxID=106335 RepID=A0A6A3CMF6_HIBSY|nr:Cysteine synthase D1 isoform 1 [Hibiscus syriacus]